VPGPPRRRGHPTLPTAGFGFLWPFGFFHSSTPHEATRSPRK
jgi:hypothetical protein